MLSEREKRIIEIEGTIAFYEETLEELFYKKGALDELEEALLRSTIEHLEELKEELIKLKRGE